MEPIWTSLFAKVREASINIETVTPNMSLRHISQALEGKDVKDLLLNVGSGGGAATAPATGGAAAAAPAEAEKEEEKEEGTSATI